MPPPVIKTVRQVIFWQYDKIVSESEGMRMIMNTYKKLDSGRN